MADTKVDLISGFLGAGKTTFIQHYGRWLASQGITYAVIENEYGAAGVDSAILSESGVCIKEISGGCICCTMKVTFHDILLDLSQRVQRIIVEPSGIYEVTQFFDVMNSPLLEGKCEVGMVVTIVDAENFADSSIMKNQLLLSGGIILSKATEENKVGALEYLKKTNCSLPVLYDGRWDDLETDDFVRFMSAAPNNEITARPDSLHANLFQSTTVYPDEIYTNESAKHILHQLMSGECGEVKRVKGYLKSDDGLIIINASGTSKSIVSSCISLKPMVNVIGKGLDRKKINNYLK